MFLTAPPLPRSVRRQTGMLTQTEDTKVGWLGWLGSFNGMRWLAGWLLLALVVVATAAWFDVL